MGTIESQLKALSQRLGLDPVGMAAYLGVKITTYRHWASGDRYPSASAIRLLQVLGVVEAMAPEIHNALIPETDDE